MHFEKKPVLKSKGKMIFQKCCSKLKKFSMILLFSKNLSLRKPCTSNPCVILAGNWLPCQLLRIKMAKIARKSFFMVLKFGFHRANLSRSAALKLNIELSLFVSQFNYRPFRGWLSSLSITHFYLLLF